MVYSSWDIYGIRRLQNLLSNRWMVLAAATWMEACSGVSYMFGLYSESLKNTLGYSQQMLDGIGMAKDIGGNVGITSGFLGDYAPNWVVLLVGAIQNAAGYGMIWLVLTKRISAPPFLLMCFYICIGTNGATFFNTAAMVTNVKNFPHSRGPAVGILKGFIGLSGAILTQVYLALYAPNKESFLLMVSWLPALVAFIVMPLIHPLPRLQEPSEQYNLLVVLAGGVGLAFFLFGASLLGQVFTVSWKVNLFVSFGILVFLAVPVVIAVKQEWEKSPEVVEIEGQQQTTSGGEVSLLAEESPSITDMGSFLGSRNLKLRGKVGVETGKESQIEFPQSGAVEEEEGYQRSPKITKPQRGEDHNLLQALVTLDFWLIYVAMTFASGSGLTAINNLGQIGKSLGYKQSEIGVFVSLMSIWNFLGRVGGGFISEYYVREQGTPRPIFMAITQGIMALGHGLFAWAFPGSVYIGSALVGLCYGAQWGIMPAVASELFGLRYFSTMYNWLTMTNPTGSFLLSVCVAGYLYDIEAEKQHHPNIIHGEALPCVGVECFRKTFLVMAFSCLSAMGASLWLSSLSKQLYTTEFQKRQQQRAGSTEERQPLAG